MLGSHHKQMPSMASGLDQLCHSLSLRYSLL